MYYTQADFDAFSNCNNLAENILIKNSAGTYLFNTTLRLSDSDKAKINQSILNQHLTHMMQNVDSALNKLKEIGTIVPSVENYAQDNAAIKNCKIELIKIKSNYKKLMAGTLSDEAMAKFISQQAKLLDNSIHEVVNNWNKDDVQQNEVIGFFQKLKQACFNALNFIIRTITGYNIQGIVSKKELRTVLLDHVQYTESGALPCSKAMLYYKDVQDFRTSKDTVAATDSMFNCLHEICKIYKLNQQDEIIFSVGLSRRIYSVNDPALIIKEICCTTDALAEVKQIISLDEAIRKIAEICGVNLNEQRYTYPLPKQAEQSKQAKFIKSKSSTKTKPEPNKALDNFKTLELKAAYETLGLKENATEAEIKQAYRKLALRWHPDKNIASDTTAKFQKFNNAYSTISEHKTALKI